MFSFGDICSAFTNTGSLSVKLKTNGFIAGPTVKSGYSLREFFAGPGTQPRNECPSPFFAGTKRT